MGLIVVLETEKGESVQRIEDPRNILLRILPPVGDSNFQCLGYIDRYGDTVFNHLQADQFLKEWNSLKGRANTPEAIGVFNGIQDLALRLKKELHLYLKFYGD
jgi:hypothetical protein